MQGGIKAMSEAGYNLWRTIMEIWSFLITVNLLVQQLYWKLQTVGFMFFLMDCNMLIKMEARNFFVLFTFDQNQASYGAAIEAKLLQMWMEHCVTLYLSKCA